MGQKLQILNNHLPGELALPSEPRPSFLVNAGTWALPRTLVSAPTTRESSPTLREEGISTLHVFALADLSKEEAHSPMGHQGTLPAPRGRLLRPKIHLPSLPSRSLSGLRFSYAHISFFLFLQVTVAQPACLTKPEAP